MLHICTNENRKLYRSQLETMHRQRYELFVKTKGWNLQVRGGGEYDEGDDERAIYLMSLDETGAVYGSLRVRPADDFSMVIDKMPHHVTGDASALRQNPCLWEMARWVNIGGDPAAGQEMRIGVIEYLLRQGATECLALPDVSILAYCIRTGWRFRALGAPQPYPEGGIAVAASLPIDAAELGYLRELTGRNDRFLMEIDAEADWADLPMATIESAYADAAVLATDFEDQAARADLRLRRLRSMDQVA